MSEEPLATHVPPHRVCLACNDGYSTMMHVWEMSTVDAFTHFFKEVYGVKPCQQFRINCWHVTDYHYREIGIYPTEKINRRWIARAMDHIQNMKATPENVMDLFCEVNGEVHIKDDEWNPTYLEYAFDEEERASIQTYLVELYLDDDKYESTLVTEEFTTYADCVKFINALNELGAEIGYFKPEINTLDDGVVDMGGNLIHKCIFIEATECPTPKRYHEAIKIMKEAA